MRRRKNNKYPYPIGWLAYAGIVSIISVYILDVVLMSRLGFFLCTISFICIVCRKGDKKHFGLDND